jgi:hypothetical protein
MRINHKIFFINLFFISIATRLYAQNDSYRSEFGFRSENDSYLAQGQDRYYTNGLTLNFRSAIDQFTLKNTKLNKLIWEIEAGQKIFNPQSGNILSINFIGVLKE